MFFFQSVSLYKWGKKWKSGNRNKAIYVFCATLQRCPAEKKCVFESCAFFFWVGNVSMWTMAQRKYRGEQACGVGSVWVWRRCSHQSNISKQLSICIEHRGSDYENDGVHITVLFLKAPLTTDQTLNLAGFSKPVRRFRPIWSPTAVAGNYSNFGGGLSSVKCF